LDKLNFAEPLPLSKLFPDIQSVVGKELFSKLIPFSVHQAASFYSEEKAKILRAQSELMSAEDDEYFRTLEELGTKNLLDEVF